MQISVTLFVTTPLDVHVKKLAFQVGEIKLNQDSVALIQQYAQRVLGGEKAMANGHGGPRKGAGRKKKSLQDSIALPGTSVPMLAIEQGVDGQLTLDNLPTVPSVSEYMTREQQGQNTELLAEQFFQEVWMELYHAGCEKHFSKAFLEDYAMQRARYVQLEELISRTGFIVKEKRSGNIIANPLENQRQSNLKILIAMRAEIDRVIREHGFVVNDPINNDPMAAVMKCIEAG